jgi:3-isopropylmalate/(R)-2-methylmalate dehydratase small subunit
LNNGVLPVQVSDQFLQKIFQQDNLSVLNIDLEKQTISIESTGEQEFFEINSYKKTCLLNGYDDIDFLINMKKEIEQFETTIN